MAHTDSPRPLRSGAGWFSRSAPIDHSARPTPSAAASLWADLQHVFSTLPHLLSDRVHLLTLELRRAVQALAQMVGLAFVAVLMLATAWWVLWGAFAWLLVDKAGWSWGWTALLIAAINLAAAGGLAYKMLALSRLLKLPATVRQLTTARMDPENFAATTSATGSASSLPSTAPVPTTAAVTARSDTL
ncbi:MAG: phage holin family protein [Pseudomonadota bacterium]